MQAGRRLLEELKQGKGAEVKWSEPELVDRTEHKGLTDAMVRQAFRADAEKLPAYMVPERFVFHAALPRNLRGKIDFDALRAWPS